MNPNKKKKTVWRSTGNYDLFGENYDSALDRLIDSLGKIKEKPLQCECGSDTVYGPAADFHSDWCPKYESK